MLKVRHFENLQGCFLLLSWNVAFLWCFMCFWPKWSLLSVMEWWDPHYLLQPRYFPPAPNSFNLPSPQFSKQLGDYERFTRKKEPCDPQLVLLHVDMCICDLLQLLFGHVSAQLTEKGIAVVTHWPLNGAGGSMYLILTAHRLVHNLQHLPGCGTESSKMCCSKLI